jgi:hypothetical protein
MKLLRISPGWYGIEGEPFEIVSDGRRWSIVDGPNLVAGPFQTRRDAASHLASILIDRGAVA